LGRRRSMGRMSSGGPRSRSALKIFGLPRCSRTSTPWLPSVRGRTTRRKQRYSPS
jgi:hypothetical protein